MRSRRGFTLLEVMVVVGIIAIITTIGIYSIYQGSKKQDVRRESKALQSALREARGMAISRPQVTGLACATPPCIPKSIGLRVVSRTLYEIIADMDTAPGAEVVVQTIDMMKDHPDNKVQFTQPPNGTIIRFNTAGAIVGVPPAVALVDTTTGEAHFLALTVAGTVSLDQ